MHVLLGSVVTGGHGIHPWVEFGDGGLEHRSLELLRSLTCRVFLCPSMMDFCMHICSALGETGKKNAP